METLNQQIATEFDQYRLLATDEDRQAFWNDVERRTNELTPEQRSTAQIGVRENIEQILRRMEEIAEQLTITENA